MVRVKLFPGKRKGNKEGKREDEEGTMSSKQLSLGGKRKKKKDESFPEDFQEDFIS